MKLALHVLSVLLFIFTGCSKDNGDFTIIGEWDAKSSTTYVYSEGQLADTEYSNIPGFTFNSDGTGTYSVNTYSVYNIFKWSLRNDTLSLLFEEDLSTQKWFLEFKNHNYMRLTKQFETHFSDFSFQFKIINEYSKHSLFNLD